jgi:microcystin-dependent protein
LTGPITTETVDFVIQVTKQGDCMIGKTTNPTTGSSLSFGVGPSGYNRGIYDNGLDKWMLYYDRNNVLRGDGKILVCSVNGNHADSAGNVITIPPGIILPFAANATPTGGFLLCNGAAVSRTTYANLYSAIGTLYGSGDGSTTFNLPNLVDRFIQYSTTAGTVKTAGLPNITGQYAMDDNCASLLNRAPIMQGAFTYKATLASDSVNGVQYRANTVGWDVAIDASLSNSIYGASSTVQPPAVTMRPYIKY